MQFLKALFLFRQASRKIQVGYDCSDGLVYSTTIDSRLETKTKDNLMTSK